VKIIFSRKGFDSQYGGVASPILPDGEITSFPIPSRFGRPVTQLSFRGKPLTDLLNDLATGIETVHLDPDLHDGSVPRKGGWRPTFGQVGSAQSHLANEGVGVGDVFLFFGWFRQVEQQQGRWRYVRRAPNIHSLFGWLQVGNVIKISNAIDVATRYPWLADHPHIQHGAVIGANNTLYVAADTLSIDGQPTGAAGAGMFRRWAMPLQLTEPGSTRSKWLLPAWMTPDVRMPPMSMHGSAARWEPAGDSVRLQTVGKGQEFVLNIGKQPKGQDWLRGLIETHGN
jgi:hypothetical protein